MEKGIIHALAVFALVTSTVSGEAASAFEQQLYAIRDSRDEICASFRMAAKFVPKYKRRESSELVPIDVYLPPLDEKAYPVSVNGSVCDRQNRTVDLFVHFSQQVFHLSVRSMDARAEGSNTTNANWTVSEIEVTFSFSDQKIFPDTNDTAENTYQVLNSPMSTVGSNGGTYKCNTPVDLELNSSNELLSLTLKDVLFSPFHDQTDDEPVVECSADSRSDKNMTTALVIGGIFAGLLVLFVLAFLVERRRFRSRMTTYNKI